MDGEEVYTGSSMWDVVVLRIDSEECSTVFVLLEIPNDPFPRGAAHILEDDEGRIGWIAGDAWAEGGFDAAELCAGDAVCTLTAVGWT